MSDIKQDITSIKITLVDYLRHPLEKIKFVPAWEWRRIFLCLYIVAASSGVLAGIASINILRVMYGLIMVPIISGLMVAVASLFFYYAFQVFLNRTVPFKHLYTVVLFANVPFFILQIASDYLPPISLFGFAFAAMLLSMGLVENFQLPKKMVIRLLSALYILFLLVWGWGRLDSMKIEKSFKKDTSIEAPAVKLGE
jgi:hypothetical protein